MTRFAIGFLLLGALLFGFAALPATLCAQDDAPRETERLTPDQRIERRVRRIAEAVELSDTQQQQIRQLMRQTRERIVAERNRLGRGTPEFKQARRQIAWESDDRLHAILTCAQRDRFRVARRGWNAERRARRARGMRGRRSRMNMRRQNMRGQNMRGQNMRGQNMRGQNMRGQNMRGQNMGDGAPYEPFDG